MLWKAVTYGVLVMTGLALKILHPDGKQLLLLSILCLMIGLGAFAAKLVTAAFLWRRLVVLHPDIKRDFIGKPLLFPGRLSHARRNPEIERYNYWYDYFMVGTPVGLRGRIGNLLSIDNLPARESSREKCWFTIDPTYYLDRGSGDRSLEEKLHIFLRSLGENPEEFPYAYLLSVPRFLWWQKSAISYWYLYSSTRELRAIIMEINNSFFEKRNIFFRVTGDDIPVDSPDSEDTVIKASTRDTKDTVSLRYMPPAPKSKHYKGGWDKMIFGSPFEKVGGWMSAKFEDPLVGPSLQSNLSSNTPEGQMRVTSRLTSWGAPVDPVTSSSYHIARFIMRWTHVGALSAPRIVKKALEIRLRGHMKYLQRPEVHEGSISRKETEVERTLEHFFREYLCQLASNCTFPLTIHYIPPKTIHFDPITFHSPSTPTPSPRPILTIQPLTPRFYTSFPQHPDVEAAFAAETTFSPTNADPESRRLLVSDPDLAHQLISTTGRSLDAELTKFGSSSLSPSRPISMFPNQSIISALRRSHPNSTTETSTFMDRFVDQSPVFSRANLQAYRTSVVHYLLACHLPVESQAIVQLILIAVRTIVVDAMLRVAYAVWNQEEVVKWLLDAGITPGIWTLFYGGWEMVSRYVGVYYTNPFAWGEGL